MNKNIVWGVVVVVVLVAGVWYAMSMNNNDTGKNNDQLGYTNPPGAPNPAPTPAPVPPNNPPPPPPGIDVGVDVGVHPLREFTVTGQSFSFSPSSLTVKKGDKVRITFKNTGGFHDLRVDGYGVGTKQINGGQQETFEFTADKAGTFEYYCSVGSHRQMGMKGTLTVTP